jgi:polyhydroxyalkanoate synthesis regulator protein
MPSAQRPAGTPSPASTPAPVASGSSDIAELKAQMAAMQKKLDELGK